MQRAAGPVERAAVTFDAPHGTESVVLADDGVAEFGRAAACPIRFGYAPIADLGIPRVAGRLLVSGGRVVVEAPDVPGRGALELLAVGQPPFLLGAGQVFAPSERTFTIVVHGQQRTWPLTVATRSREWSLAEAPTDEPTHVHELAFSDAQRRVLEAYIAPLRRGRLEPATHREVADHLGCHPNWAREVIYTVWSTMFAADIPMPDIADKRVAVTEAIRLHRLL